MQQSRIDAIIAKKNEPSGLMLIGEVAVKVLEGGKLVSRKVQKFQRYHVVDVTRLVFKWGQYKFLILPKLVEGQEPDRTLCKLWQSEPFGLWP